MTYTIGERVKLPIGEYVGFMFPTWQAKFGHVIEVKPTTEEVFVVVALEENGALHAFPLSRIAKADR